MSNHTLLARYRVLSNVVGAVLIVLVVVAVPLKYVGHQPILVATVGPVHGVLYLVYLATAFALSRRFRWPVPTTVVVLLAGTVPFLTFVVERRVTRRVRAEPTFLSGS